jgi:hypothetical protein
VCSGHSRDSTLGASARVHRASALMLDRVLDADHAANCCTVI